MPNTINPSGFRYAYRLSDQSPPVKSFPVSGALAIGDPVRMVPGSGLVVAVAGEAVLGVVLGPEANSDYVYTFDGGKTTPILAGENALVCLALSDVVFQIEDSDDGGTEVIGKVVDYAGTIGERVLQSNTVGTSCYILDIAGADDINGNVGGPGADFLVTFLIRALA